MCECVCVSGGGECVCVWVCVEGGGDLCVRRGSLKCRTGGTLLWRNTFISNILVCVCVCVSVCEYECVCVCV